MNNNQNSQNNNNENNNNQPDKKKPSPMVILLIISVVLALMFGQAYSRFKRSGQEEISYSEFLQMLDDNNVADVKIYGDVLTFKPVNSETDTAYEVSYTVVRTSDYNLVERLKAANVS